MYFFIPPIHQHPSNQCCSDIVEPFVFSVMVSSCVQLVYWWGRGVKLGGERMKCDLKRCVDAHHDGHTP